MLLILFEKFAGMLSRLLDFYLIVVTVSLCYVRQYIHIYTGRQTISTSEYQLFQILVPLRLARTQSFQLLVSFGLARALSIQLLVPCGDWRGLSHFSFWYP